MHMHDNVLIMRVRDLGHLTTNSLAHVQARGVLWQDQRPVCASLPRRGHPFGRVLFGRPDLDWPSFIGGLHGQHCFCRWCEPLASLFFSIGCLHVMLAPPQLLTRLVHRFRRCRQPRPGTLTDKSASYAAEAMCKNTELKFGSLCLNRSMPMTR